MGANESDSPRGLCTSDEAIARLKEGNARFVAGHARFPTVQKDILADLVTIGTRGPVVLAHTRPRANTHWIGYDHSQEFPRRHRCRCR